MKSYLSWYIDLNFDLAPYGQRYVDTQSMYLRALLLWSSLSWFTTPWSLTGSSHTSTNDSNLRYFRQHFASNFVTTLQRRTNQTTLFKVTFYIRTGSSCPFPQDDSVKGHLYYNCSLSQPEAQFIISLTGIGSVLWPWSPWQLPLGTGPAGLYQCLHSHPGDRQRSVSHSVFFIFFLTGCHRVLNQLIFLCRSK